MPPPPRTKWTRRVPYPVLIGHAASLATPFRSAGRSTGVHVSFCNQTRPPALCAPRGYSSSRIANSGHAMRGAPRILAASSPIAPRSEPCLCPSARAQRQAGRQRATGAHDGGQRESPGRAETDLFVRSYVLPGLPQEDACQPEPARRGGGAGHRLAARRAPRAPRRRRGAEGRTGSRERPCRAPCARRSQRSCRGAALSRKSRAGPPRDAVARPPLVRGRGTHPSPSSPPEAHPSAPRAISALYVSTCRGLAASRWHRQRACLLSSWSYQRDLPPPVLTGHAASPAPC